MPPPKGPKERKPWASVISQLKKPEWVSGLSARAVSLSVTWLGHRSPCPLLCPCPTELSPELLIEVPAQSVLFNKGRAGLPVLVAVPAFWRRQGRRRELWKPQRVLLRAGMLTQLQAAGGEPLVWREPQVLCLRPWAQRAQVAALQE